MRTGIPLSFLLLLTACGGGSPGAGTPTPAPSPPDGLHVRTESLADGTVGTPYLGRLEAAGGTGVGNTWRIVSGALPAGLDLDGGPSCLDWEPWSQSGTIQPDETTGERTEISGLAASRRNPGILWAHDDSGGAAILHAIAADGSLRQRYVLDATPFDWEDLALGPGPDPETEYLYIGDVGDNSKARPHVTILRVGEPIVPEAPGDPLPISHEAFPIRYPGEARDCEALVVDWETGTPYLLEKNEAGGDVFRVPTPLDTAWTPAAPATMTAVTTGRPLPGSVTAASAARDGRRLVLRTYTLGYEVVVPSTQGFESLFATPPCPFAAPLLGQYESLAWAADGGALYTTTELVLGSVAPLHRTEPVAAERPATIEGSTNSTGTFTFTVEVRELSGATATRTLTLTIR